MQSRRRHRAHRKMIFGKLEVSAILWRTRDRSVDENWRIPSDKRGEADKNASPHLACTLVTLTGER